MYEGVRGSWSTGGKECLQWGGGGGGDVLEKSGDDEDSPRREDKGGTVFPGTTAAHPFKAAARSAVESAVTSGARGTGAEAGGERGQSIVQPENEMEICFRYLFILGILVKLIVLVTPLSPSAAFAHARVRTLNRRM